MLYDDELNHVDMSDTNKIDNLSDYEKRRAKNIEKNNKRLCVLGLLTEAEAKTLNNAAWKRGEMLNALESENEKNQRKNYETGKCDLDSATTAKKQKVSLRQRMPLRSSSVGRATAVATV